MSKAKKKLSKAEIEKKVLRILERARSQPRFREARERDALIDAINYGDSDLAVSLLANGVDPNLSGPKSRSALWHAAFWSREEVIRDLVGRGAILPDDVLMGPVHDGNVQLVRFLIRHGANVNCVATYTRYCWHSNLKKVLLAVAIQQVPLIANAEQTGDAVRTSQTPRWRAKHPPGPLNGDLEQIPIMLIKAGAQVNRFATEYPVYENFIPTMLGLASGRGYTRTVKAMLTAGADVNFRDTWGGTALLSAATSGQMKIAKLLLAAGAKKVIKRKDGATPFTIARDAGFMELAYLLAN